mgnify:CR=1 FL=1
MALRVVLKEDRQALGDLFDALRAERVDKFNEEVRLRFFDRLDFWFELINRPAAAVFDKQAKELALTRQKS